MFIATNWNPIYWNTACLIVDSGSLEDNSQEELVDIYEEEASDFAEGITYEDLPDKSAKIRKTASTDYSKVATALGKIIGEGIKVSLTDINESDFSFKPDVKNNQILFGLKGLLNVSDDFIKDIIANRPYKSPLDFINKVKPKKQGMISLIKSGAFNNMIPDTKLCLAWYIWETCDKKKLVNMRNMLSLIKNDIIDPNMYPKEYKIFEFNRYLKAICKIDKDTYSTNERVINFLTSIGQEELVSDDKTISAKKWDKIYQKEMDVFRNWMKENQKEIVDKLNETVFKKDWLKYAGNKPNLSKWEMEVMCFYYHEHELKNVNKPKYGIMDFSKLPREPVVDYTFKKGDKEIKMFILNKIAGTCIAKNKTKGIVTILTESGVVNVKFPRDYFNLFDRQISEKQPDGKKKVIEKSWFGRGNKIIVTGIRQGDDFISKKYSKTPGHRLYHILDILPEGDLEIQSERIDVDAKV